MHRATLRTTAAAAVAALVISPLTAAHADWTGPTAVPEGPEGSDVPSGKRLTSDLAVGRDGTQWFAWVLTTDTTATIANAATQRVLVSSRPDGGAWQAPTELGSVQRIANSNYDQVNDVEVDLDAAGNPTVAWNVVAGGETPSPTAPSTAQSIHVRTRTAGTWGPSTTLGPTALTVNAIDLPISLDVAPDGQAALAWQDDEGVHLARRTSGTWGSLELADVGPTTARTPDTVGIGIDQNGATTLAWRAYDETASAWDVRARTMNSGGGWGTVATLDDDATLAARTSLAVDTTGVAVATWGTGDGARAATRTAAGAWGGEQTLSTGSANAAVAPAASIPAYGLPAGKGIPSAAFDPYGVASVVWPEVEPAPRIAIATVGADGQIGTATTVAEGTSPNVPVAPRIVLARDGATAAWSRGVATVGGISGGQAVLAQRDASGTWGEPTTYTQPGAGSNPTVLGLNNHANLGFTGDELGDVLAGWTSFQSWTTPNLQQAQTVSSVADRSAALEWTARGVGGSTNIRSWLNYLRTDWAGTTACPVGVHGIEVSGDAEMPSARDDSSWRFAQTDAYRLADGRRVTQYAGTLRWALDAHCIDIRITDPRLEVSADGATARLYADGQATGSMGEVLEGNPSVTPFTNLRILDIDLAGAGPRSGGDTRSWLSAPVRLNAGAASTMGLDLYANQPFGFLTVTTPDVLYRKAAVAVAGPATTVAGTSVPLAVSVPGATGTVKLTGAGAHQSLELDGGTATFTVPATLPAGTHTLEVAYQGDAEFGAASATHVLTVTAAPLPPEPLPTVSMTATSTSEYGAPVEVRVSVPGRSGEVSLTGAGAARTATVASGVATFSVAGLRPGAHRLAASYGGGSATADIVVTKARQTVGAVKVLKAPTPRKPGRARLTVATSTGVAPGGKAVVTLTKGKVTRSMTVQVRRATTTVRLPKLPRGTWQVRVRIGATALVEAAPAKAVKVRVR